MLPSDHFVRFYNEIFKFLDRQGPGHLEKYWREISRHQERHCLKFFREQGLRGMYDYWEHIRIEENCDLTLGLTDDCLHLIMNKCPSLSKVLDNDAEPSPRYCEHCPGWVIPLIHKAGHYCVYAIGAADVPQCEAWIYREKNKASEKIRELKELNVEYRTYKE
ncbi:MAG: hypothetical protein PHV59_03635 [Victivallales bacterium]|nr:hypothetical protein [Victivallales bacterium]